MKHRLFLVSAILFYFVSNQIQGSNALAQAKLNWQQTNGPFVPVSFSIDHLIMDSESNIYAGTNHGMYRSTNNGKKWKHCGRGLDGALVDACVNKGRIFVATFVGIYFSSDKGESWGKIPSSIIANPGQISGIGVNPDGVIFASYRNDKNHLYNYGLRSTDMGVSWEYLNIPTGASDFEVIGTDISGELYCEFFAGLNISMDLGETWQEVVIDTSVFISFPRLLRLNDSTIVAAVYHVGLYISYDNGKHYNKLKGFEDRSFRFINKAQNDSTWIIGNLYETNDTTFITHDMGKSWVPILPDSPSTSFNCSLLTNDGVILLGTGGIYYHGRNIWGSTDNGFTWSTYDSAFGGMQQIGVSPDGNVWATAGNVQLFKSTDFGSTWVDANQPDHAFSENFIFNPGGDIFTCEYYDSIYKSTDQGMHWHSLPVPETRNISSLGDDIMIVAYDSSAYVSFDKGESWIEKRLNLDTALHPFTNSVTVSANGEVWIGTSEGMYISDDTCKSFQRFPLNFEPYKFAHAQSGRTYAIASDTKLYYTTDNARTWGEITNLPFYGFIEDCMFANKNFFIVSGYGVFRTTDDGNTWIQEDINIGNRMSSCIAHFGSYTYVGTDAGVYRAIDTMLSVRQDLANSKNLSLSIHPNPTASIVTVSYHTQKASAVEITMYSVTGKPMSKIRRTEEEGGDHEIQIDLGKYPAGVYFISISAYGVTGQQMVMKMSEY